jgi:hypothetical protein
MEWWSSEQSRMEDRGWRVAGAEVTEWINGMNEQSNVGLAGARKAVIDALRNRVRKARFTTELAAALQRAKIGKEEMEQALADLQAEGIVMIRDNFCADPHLAGVDLRVVALIESNDGADPQLNAIREIDGAWNKWLGEYLANHRCG